MNPLFSKSSLMILESLSFTRTLYAFDYDGTLSRIVRAPEEATIAPATEALIRRFSELVPVVVVSGRSLEDLRRRVGPWTRFLVGNHGLERLDGVSGGLEEARKICRVWKGELMRAPFEAGVEVEDKAYSLAIHYRRSRSKRLARAGIRAAVLRLKPAPRVIDGKCVLNLVPSSAPHKGIAVQEILRRSGLNHAFYIGDDDTDEDVFGLNDPRVMTVRVGKKKSSQARYFIERQSDINRLLELLISFHARA